MSDDPFLRRWSRRKLGVEPRDEEPEATAGAENKPPPPPTETGAVTHQADVPRQIAPEPFDITKLPPLDSIVATTDIKPFLQKGVPVDLQRAALRHAWSADPAIRDFVGLAENAWDFNDPSAIPGFGPLDATPQQVRDMVARAFGEWGKIEEQIGGESADIPFEPGANVPPTGQRIGQETAETTVAAQAFTAETSSHRGPESPEPTVVRRTHGGALPT
jgi:hypothetical protein